MWRWKCHRCEKGPKEHKSSSNKWGDCLTDFEFGETNATSASEEEDSAFSLLHKNRRGRLLFVLEPLFLFLFSYLFWTQKTCSYIYFINFKSIIWQFWKSLFFCHQTDFWKRWIFSTSHVLKWRLCPLCVFFVQLMVSNFKQWQIQLMRIFSSLNVFF